jgi:hypothetical protein
MGLAALILWGMFLLLSFVFAGAIGLQRGRKGIKWAGITVLGAGMTYAFVCVVLGFLELDGYSKSISFVYTLGIGVAGLVLFGWGVTKLRS